MNPIEAATNTIYVNSIKLGIPVEHIVQGMTGLLNGTRIDTKEVAFIVGGSIGAVSISYALGRLIFPDTENHWLPNICAFGGGVAGITYLIGQALQD